MVKEQPSYLCGKIGVPRAQEEAQQVSSSRCNNPARALTAGEREPNLERKTTCEEVRKMQYANQREAKVLRGLLLSMLLCVFSTVVCWSQATQQFTGQVLDSTGAVIPSAHISVRNQGTGVVVKTDTTNAGSYTVPYLIPGTYDITVSKAGFKTTTKTNILLNVDQTSTINFNLSVGAQTEQVTVNASATQIDVSDADRGQVISGHLTEQMPLDGRNPYTLFSLAAGTHDFSSAQYPRPFDNVTGNQYVNGSPQVSQTNVDGIGNDASDAGRTAYTPSVDVIQEFKVVTNAYDASYGLSGGSAIDVQLKSGTNQFHGTVDEFARRSWLDSYDWQSKYNNPTNPSKPPHKRDQYGFEADGPIIIPHLFNGKNKLFFTAAYEEMKDILPNPSYNVYSLPNPAWLTGDFNGATYWNTTTNSLQPLTIYDPLTPLHSVVDPYDGKTKLAHSPFPNNKIPSDRIDPVAANILSYYSYLKPNVDPGPGYAPWSNNYENLQVENDLWRNAMIKVDWNLDQNNKFAFRWAGQGRWIKSNWNVGAPDNDPANNNGHGSAPKTETGSVQWTHIFSPNLLLNMGASLMTYDNQQDEGTKQAKDFVSSLGFASSYYGQIQNTNYFPNINPSGLPGAQGYAFFGPSWLGYSGDRHALDLLPTLTYIHGAHTIRAGINIDFFQWLSPTGGNSDSFNFDTNFSQEYYNSPEAPGYASGQSIASLLLGYPDSGTVWWNLHPFYSQHYFAPWAQDDWKVTRKLTLNLGLRWDFLTPEVERHNAMTGAFNATVLNPVSSMIPTGTAALGTNTNLQGGLTFSGVNGQSRGAYAMNMLEVQPRLGFAYVIANNMVIRGGIGQNYMNDQTINGSDGFSNSTSYTNSLDGGITPYTSTTGQGLSNPIPVIKKATGSSLGYMQDLGSSFSFTNPHYHSPSFWQYSLTYEIAPTRNDSISVSYVGNRVPNQPESSNVNIGSPQWNAQCDIERGGNRQLCDNPTYGDIANPYLGISAFEGSSYYNSSVVSKYNFTRPYPEFADITENGATNNGKSWYNSFQAQWSHRLTDGLMLNASYTHARSMTSGAWVDQVNHVRARQVSGTNDVNHSITFAGIGTLPFGRGRLLFSNASGWVDALINGWEISPLYSYYSGFAWFPKDSGGSGGMYDYSGNWELVSTGGPITHTMGVQHTVLPPDNTHKFQRLRGVTPCVGYKDTDTGDIIPSPAAVAAGCSNIEFARVPNSYAVGRNNETFGVRQPGAFKLDASASKNFKIPGATKVYLSENTNLQVRVDMFNVLNHPNWDESYNNDPTSIDFGTISEGPSGPTNLPRYLQLSAKLSW